MTDKPKWKPLVAGIGLVLAVFGAGFYVGDLRERFNQARFFLVEQSRINAKLDAYFYDAIRQDNDVIILGSFPSRVARDSRFWAWQFSSWDWHAADTRCTASTTGPY